MGFLDFAVWDPTPSRTYEFLLADMRLLHKAGGPLFAWSAISFFRRGSSAAISHLLYRATGRDYAAFEEEEPRFFDPRFRVNAVILRTN